jgi:hypothetical protein
MADRAATQAPPREPLPHIRFRNLLWVALALLVTALAVRLDEPWPP